MRKTLFLVLIAIVTVITIAFAQKKVTESYVADIDNKFFLQEIQNATYVGNFYATEAVGNIIVSHHFISDNPRIETVKGYMSFMASETINKEMGNIGVISEFDLREPSKRLCHEIIKVGDAIQVGSEKLIINLFIGDPVIYDYSATKLYYVFRCGMNNTKQGCSIGCFIDKATFKILDAHYEKLDGKEIARLSSTQNIWSNTRIEKYKDTYYRAFRDNVNNKIIIARSKDLINWVTWMDVSVAMRFVEGTSRNSFDETDIAIDEANSILYFAVRSNYLVLGKVEIKDNPSIDKMSYVSDITPTRPSLVYFNDNLFVFCNKKKDNSGDNNINGTMVNRAYPALIRLDSQLAIQKEWSGFSCIGGNYQVLYSYGSQLLSGLNFNKQGLSNTASLERCGVYFTPLYSICNSN